MAVAKLNKTKEEIEALLKETEDVLDEMSDTLSSVEVKVSKNSPDILKAIKEVFGANYIRADGSSVITYKMFSQVNKILRNAGKLKVKEYI